MNKVGLKSRLARKLRARRRLRRGRREVWEQKWATEGYLPPWHMDQLPWEIEEAVESGWLPPGSSLLDIGCGTGELTSRLADLGYPSTGVDFASSAIERARVEYSGAEGAADVRFEVVDICGDTSHLGTFDALIDRGCFHGLHKGQHASYVKNVAAMCEPGAPFLLMCQVRDASPRARSQQVEAAFGSAFTIERTEETFIGSGAKDDGIQGLSFWMVRR